MSAPPDLATAIASALAPLEAARQDRRADFEERAAILEFDHGLTRDQAERQAAEETGWKAEKAD